MEEKSINNKSEVPTAPNENKFQGNEKNKRNLFYDIVDNVITELTKGLYYLDDKEGLDNIEHIKLQLYRYLHKEFPFVSYDYTTTSQREIERLTYSLLNRLTDFKQQLIELDQQFADKIDSQITTLQQLPFTVDAHILAKDLYNYRFLFCSTLYNQREFSNWLNKQSNKIQMILGSFSKSFIRILGDDIAQYTAAISGPIKNPSIENNYLAANELDELIKFFNLKQDLAKWLMVNLTSLNRVNEKFLNNHPQYYNTKKLQDEHSKEIIPAMHASQKQFASSYTHRAKDNLNKYKSNAHLAAIGVHQAKIINQNEAKEELTIKQKLLQLIDEIVANILIKLDHIIKNYHDKDLITLRDYLQQDFTLPIINEDEMELADMQAAILEFKQSLESNINLIANYDKTLQAQIFDYINQIDSLINTSTYSAKI